MRAIATNRNPKTYGRGTGVPRSRHMRRCAVGHGDRTGPAPDPPPRGCGCGSLGTPPPSRGVPRFGAFKNGEIPGSDRSTVPSIARGAGGPAQPRERRRTPLPLGAAQGHGTALPRKEGAAALRGAWPDAPGPPRPPLTTQGTGTGRAPTADLPRTGGLDVAGRDPRPHRLREALPGSPPPPAAAAAARGARGAPEGVGAPRAHRVSTAAPAGGQTPVHRRRMPPAEQPTEP